MSPLVVENLPALTQKMGFLGEEFEAPKDWRGILMLPPEGSQDGRLVSFKASF
jgi:hypothetical protein